MDHLTVFVSPIESPPFFCSYPYKKFQLILHSNGQYVFLSIRTGNNSLFKAEFGPVRFIRIANSILRKIASKLPETESLDELNSFILNKRKLFDKSLQKLKKTRKENFLTIF